MFGLTVAVVSQCFLQCLERYKLVLRSMWQHFKRDLQPWMAFWSTTFASIEGIFQPDSLCHSSSIVFLSLCVTFLCLKQASVGKRSFFQFSVELRHCDGTIGFGWKDFLLPFSRYIIEGTTGKDLAVEKWACLRMFI